MKITLKPYALLIAMLAALSSILASCKKDKNEKQAEGMMINTGSPAADGCGWLIAIDKVMYSPDNLPASFMQDSLKVKVDYTNLKTRFGCGMIANTGFPQIHIKNISKK
ncbi:hypothetical protein LJ707_14570 [Mucilaginibacter sp. UR6-1]|uniref:hypothetical protein n=1 Tax=Mucilaginibacter sp. UR6-1 TaxID=1435643 RepID=UPI001E2BBCC1|nr:hypothetical protein [Mucilaginibacter sp. UR6-1]MCC8410161.1 hypothetical protein [Mucilaginibacter sp. UR6-1]